MSDNHREEIEKSVIRLFDAMGMPFGNMKRQNIYVEKLTEKKFNQNVVSSVVEKCITSRKYLPQISELVSECTTETARRNICPNLNNNGQSCDLCLNNGIVYIIKKQTEWAAPCLCRNRKYWENKPGFKPPGSITDLANSVKSDDFKIDPLFVEEMEFKCQEIMR